MSIKYLKNILLLILSLFYHKGYSSYTKDQIDSSKCFKKIHIASLEDFLSKFKSLKLDPSVTIVGWDYDNTIATVPTDQCILDSERFRDLKNKFIQAAETLGQEANIFYGNINHIKNLQEHNNIFRQYTFVEERPFIDVYNFLKSQGIPQFICTGLKPEKTKVALLTDNNIEFYYGIEERSSAGDSFLPGAFGFLLAAGESKSASLEYFMQVINYDRKLKGLPPIQNFIFIDNYYGVMNDIEAIQNPGLNRYGFHYTYRADHLTINEIVDCYTRLSSLQ